MPCVIGKTDFMMWVKQHVGMKSQVILTISCVRPNHSSLDNRVPEEYGGMKYRGECVWEYEIEGFWSTRKCD